MWPNPQKTADLVTFTVEILNGKLHFLCSDHSRSVFILLKVTERHGEKRPEGRTELAKLKTIDNVWIAVISGDLLVRCVDYPLSEVIICNSRSG